MRKEPAEELLTEVVQMQLENKEEVLTEMAE